jgi:hypothetical protein
MPSLPISVSTVSRAGGSPRLKISSVNEVDCRGSRRATMNQTQHQRWAYRSAGLQALVESTAHNKNAKVAAR